MQNQCNKWGLFQDWSVNRENPKARLVLFFFRLAFLLRHSGKIVFFLALPYLLFYRFFVEWLLGIELPWNLRLGPSARIFHGYALVVNDQVKIGSGVILRHSTTIGSGRTSEFGSQDVPVIGNNVDVGANSIIIGKILVGDGVVIGAGSVVVKDVPANCVVVGNPARVIRSLR